MELRIPVLSTPEQYDTFVKFTHDQLMRRFGEQPASCEFFQLSLAPTFLLAWRANMKRYFISLFSRCFLSVVRKSLRGWPALAARHLYDLQRETPPSSKRFCRVCSNQTSHCAIFLSMGELLPRSRHQFLPLLSINAVLPDVN